MILIFYDKNMSVHSKKKKIILQEYLFFTVLKGQYFEIKVQLKSFPRSSIVTTSWIFFISQKSFDENVKSPTNYDFGFYSKKILKIVTMEVPRNGFFCFACLFSEYCPFNVLAI